MILEAVLNNQLLPRCIEVRPSPADTSKMHENAINVMNIR